MRNSICVALILFIMSLFFGGCSDKSLSDYGVSVDNSNMGSGMGSGMGMGLGARADLPTSSDSTPITPPPASVDLNSPVSTDSQSQRQAKPEPTLRGSVLFCANYNIFLFRLEDGKCQSLTKDGNANVSFCSPSWLPQNKGVLFVMKSAEGSSICTMNSDGSRREILFETSDLIADAAMSPDGKRIVYCSAAKGGLWIVNSDGTDARLLVETNASDPVWSPDGKQIAFSYLKSDNDYGVCTISPDGTGLKNLTRRFAIYGKQPCWSPESKKIVFSTGHDLCVVRADGSGVSFLTNDDTKYRDNPEWLPDGSTVVFERRLSRDGEPNFCVVDASGNGERLIDTKQ